MRPSTTNPARPRGRWLYLVGILGVAASVLLLGRLLKTQKSRLLVAVEARAKEVNAGPAAMVMTVGNASSGRTVTLVGEAHPYRTVTLYAKVSGYLKEIRVDRGDKVEANQVVAVIESPETDQQHLAAVADAKNKRLNAERARTLVKRDMIAQQDADQAETDARVAEANLAALATLKSYEVLRAPSAGTVTARYADPGALLQNAANAQTSALPLVTISETDRLRIYVYPGQRDATFIRVGNRAEISLPERPEIKLVARVTRTSGVLDPKTRTLLTEVDLDNPRGLILPGSFVQVSLQIRGPAYLEAPAEALVMRGSQPFVAVVSPDNRVSYRAVVLGNDDGAKLRIVSGLEPGERVALNLGDTVAEGAQIRPIASR